MADMLEDNDDDWIADRIGLDKFERQSAARGFGMPDFWWVRPDKSGRGVLIDNNLDRLPCFDLHGYMVAGHNGKPRKQYESCLLQRYKPQKLAALGFAVPPCCANTEMRPIDQSMDRNTAFQTIVDGTSFIDKNGNNRQFELRLFPVNGATLKTMKRLRSNWEYLHGWIVSFSRSGDKAPRVGDVWEREVDKETKMLVPKDLTKLFRAVLFRGKKVATLYDEAEREIAERAAERAAVEAELAKVSGDPNKTASLTAQIAALAEPGEKTRYVRHYFDTVIIDGKIQSVDSNKVPIGRSVPIFNYTAIFKPKSPEEFVRAHGTAGAAATGAPRPEPVRTGQKTANHIGGGGDDGVAF